MKEKLADVQALLERLAEDLPAGALKDRASAILALVEQIRRTEDPT